MKKETTLVIFGDFSYNPPKRRFIMDRIKKVKSNEKDLVVQDNSLIDASKDLNILEYKLFMLVVSKINPQEEKLPVFKISAAEFAKLANAKTTKSMYRELQKVADRLVTRSARIYSPERNLTIKTNLTKQVRYWHGEGYIEIELSDAIKPYLVNLYKEFTQYKLSCISRLSSVYAIRLYEMLKRNELLGRRIFGIPELRTKLGLSEKQYLRISDFKRYVLDIARREINAKTDLFMDYSFKKERQKFVAIKFDISSKSTGAYYLPFEQQAPLASVRKIMNIGYSFLEATDMLNKANQEIVENAVNAVEEQIENNNAKNPKAMLQTAIQREWKPKKNTSKVKSVYVKKESKSTNSYVSKILDLFKVKT